MTEEMLQVILVDEEDNQTGMLEKMEAHRQGLLHRAFSIFICNQNGEMLLQKRAISKYHSGGLWTNACCSHPFLNEDTGKAAHRRLKEELGFDCELEEIFDFIYEAPLDHGLTEHEFDHVFIGHYELLPEWNTEEVSACEYFSVEEIQSWLQTMPEVFTAWFKIAFPLFVDYLQAKQGV